MKSFLERILKAVVGEPEAVHIKESSTPKTSIFEIRIAPDDLNKIVDEKGSTIRAIRNILRRASGDTHQKNATQGRYLRATDCLTSHE